MTDRARVGVDLIVIATNKTLVTEEVDGLVLGSGDVLLGLDVLQAVGLVPASGEDVERDLATNGEALFRKRQFPSSAVNIVAVEDLRETRVGELLLQGLHHILPNVVDLIVANAIVSCDAQKSMLLWRSCPLQGIETYASNSSRSSTLALRPMGLTLIMPLRNSTNVPRFLGSLSLEMYPRQKSASSWYFSSPSHWMKLLLESDSPRR